MGPCNFAQIINYRVLNSASKPALFPLPITHDLLGKIFTALDIKPGHWQIKINLTSQEKM